MTLRLVEDAPSPAFHSTAPRVHDIAADAAVGARDRRRPALLTVIPGAGFTFETGCLVRELAADMEIVFLRTCYGGEPGRDGLPAGEAFTVAPFPSLTQPSRLGRLAAAWSAFVVTLRVLLTRRIDVVVVVGTPHAVPTLLAARLLRRRTVFVESITRADRLSQTGRLVRRLRLASRLLVQWPELQDREAGVAVGTIL